jgi:hypothetical protein
MIRVTRQIKCLIAQRGEGVIPHPLPEVNFLMVELGVGYNPWGLSYKTFNLPSHPDHKYIWFSRGDLNH